MASQPMIPLGDNPFSEEGFTTVTFVYKYVQSVPIHVDCDGARSGPSMTFGPWAAAYAWEHNAIVISPGYRLSPKAKTPQIVEGLVAFWHWLHSTLPSVLEGRSIQLDLDRVIVRGGSAGGWCALHLGLRFPTEIRALILTWPLIDAGSDHFVKGNGGRPLFPGILDISVPKDDFRAAWLKAKDAEASEKIVTGLQLERNDLMFGIVQYGNSIESMGDFDEIFPLRAIRKATGQLPPLIWISHGEDDSVVPAEHSRDFAELVRKSYPDTRVVLDIRPGEHSFDDAIEYTDPWLRERLQMIVRRGLRK